MGISPFAHWKNCNLYEGVDGVNAPNPDPLNYEILKSKQIGKNVVIKVRYPNCTNYEDIKILLYRNVTMVKISSMDLLDPHFSENGISPFLRIEPTEEGWDVACLIAAYI